MKSLLVYAWLAVLVIGLPQRGGQCQCRDVICPNTGRESCECMNRAAVDCFKTWRNPSCPSPTPMNCNGSNPRPPQGPFQTGTATRPPAASVTTYYSVVPYRTTITTTLPGFGWPNPVTSYSYSMSTTTITLVKSNGGGPGEPQNPNSGIPGNPRVTTITVPKSSGPPPKSSWTPPWSVPKPPPSDFTPAPTTPRPPPPTTPSPPPKTTPPPRSSTPRPDPWTPPTNTGPVWTPISTPSIPLEAPPEQTPPPVPEPAPPVPVQPGNPGPGGLMQCGPGKPRCTSNTYCDPQPLCSIGEDCDGVCLPIVQIRQVGVAHAMYSQPWDKRREVWQRLLDEGYYVMYRYSI